MNALSSPIMVDRPQLNLLEKTATLGSWGLAGAVFLTIGWIAMAPDDPLGAVSVLAHRGGVLMLVQAAALAAVAAAVATVVAGRSLADVGTFAAALGLAAVSLRGGTAGTLLVDYADVASAYERRLALGFAVESIGWFAVVLGAVAVSAFVMRWCFPPSGADDGESSDVRAVAARTMAGYDVPGLGSVLFGTSVERQTSPADGVRHTAITAILGLLCMGVLSSGLSSRSIQHGQACFVVAAGVCAASYFAHRFAPVRSSLWGILAVPVIAVAAYIWAAVLPKATGLPAPLPSSHFLRVLPIQLISVGTAAVLTMFRYMYDPSPSVGSNEERMPAGHTSRRGRR